MYGGYGRGGGFHRRGFSPGQYHRSYSDSGAGCMFCTGVPESQESHTRQQCSVFRQLKKNVSFNPYVQAELNDRDEQGFAAAGFLLWKKGSGDKVEVLMAREFRDRVDNLNFLGGKRVRKAETAIEVALRKVNMESGGKLSREALEGMKRAPLVHWSGKSSKYALFLFEVTLWRDCEVDVLAAGLRGEGVKRLEWVSCQELQSASFIRHELHEFALEMVSALSDPACDVLGNIKELFEAAKSATEAVEMADKSQEKVSFDFDVIAALTSSASLARGFCATGDTTWGTIADAVNSLHRNDIRKLTLKFHPDRLSGQLKRDPTELEKKASTKAMQVLNMIQDMVKDPSKQPARSSSTGDVFKTISELKQLIKIYSGDTDDGGDKVATAITAKLSEIKLR